jgi:hypothetical protein
MPEQTAYLNGILNARFYRLFPGLEFIMTPLKMKTLQKHVEHSNNALEPLKPSD